MARKNRVDPTGRIFAESSKASEIMGNRGRLHDATRTTVRERTSSKAWICCTMQEPFGRRDIDKVNTYTELFFLDEATAMAAGHRPCHDCRRDALKLFKDSWFGAGVKGLVTEIDDTLDRERLSRVRSTAMVTDLPDGAIVSLPSNDGLFLVSEKVIFPWSFGGYGVPLGFNQLNEPVEVVTLPSMIRVLRAGYKPVLHSSLRRV